MQMRQQSCMARSVADKFLKREDVLFFPLKYFYSNFGEIPPFTDNTTGNKMSQKEGEKTGILFIEVRGMRGHYFGGGGRRKKLHINVMSRQRCYQAACYAS